LSTPLLLLGGPGRSTLIVYNRLVGRFGNFPAIIEEPVSKLSLVRNRIRKIGIRSTLSQLVFLATIQPLLFRFAQKRLSSIFAEYRLDDDEIPEPYLQRVSSVNSAETINTIRALSPRVIIVNGTRIIGRKVLESIPTTFLNTHAGITPKYRGAHGAYWALLNDDPDHCGVTIHIVDPGIDTGSIVGQAKIAPTPEDSFVTYPYLQLAAALPLLVDSVQNALEGKLTTKPAEGETGVWYHPGALQYLIGRARGVK
jgi:folate-dependent phosphoribosylglycinamide formyltransferase PurN